MVGKLEFVVLDDALAGKGLVGFRGALDYDWLKRENMGSILLKVDPSEAPPA